jgi:hypothetical protein
MKKTTSLEYILDLDDSGGCFDEKSTLVHTERKIEIDD